MKKFAFAFVVLLLMGAGVSSAKKNKAVSKNNSVLLTPGSVTFNVEDVEIASDILPVTNGFELARKLAEGPYLNSSFDRKSIVDADDNPFFSMVCLAYAQHRPIVLSPDIMWIIICNGYSQYVNRDPEGFRDYLVKHEGKETLIIRTRPETPTAQKVEQFAALIDKETKGGLAELMTCNFSTTGMVERMVSQITLMDAVKPYFEYVEMFSSCGIPRITLEGTSDDWELLREKTRQLGEYGVKEWTDRLDPILAEFVSASEGKPNLDFWWDMAIKGRPKDFHLESEGGCGFVLKNGTRFDGWFLEFIPFDTSGELPRAIAYGHVLPPLLTSVPVIQHIEDDFGNLIGVRALELRAGIVGLSQDSETKTLRPEVGWIVMEKEKYDVCIDVADVSSKAAQVKAMGDGDAVLEQPVKWEKKTDDLRSEMLVPIRMPENKAAKDFGDKSRKSESKVVVTGDRPAPGDTIRGIVMDSEGPMMMVSVNECDSVGRRVAFGISNIDGEFSFCLVDPNDRLQVNFVGYETAESSFTGNYFEITLADIENFSVEIVSERVE